VGVVQEDIDTGGATEDAINGCTDKCADDDRADAEAMTWCLFDEYTSSVHIDKNSLTNSAAWIYNEFAEFFGKNMHTTRKKQSFYYARQSTAQDLNGKHRRVSAERSLEEEWRRRANCPQRRINVD
jgi:hypothetical protein